MNKINNELFSLELMKLANEDITISAFLNLHRQDANAKYTDTLEGIIIQLVKEKQILQNRIIEIYQTGIIKNIGEKDNVKNRC